MKRLKNPDKLDKYRQHLLEGKDLNQEETQMLAKYRRAFAIMSVGYGRQNTVKILSEETGLSESQTYMVVRDAIKLFGDVHEVDKKGLKSIMYENFMLAASMARADKDHAAMIRALEKAAELYGLFDSETEGLDPKMFLPVPILFTSDPGILKKNQTIDITHEPA